MNIATIKVSGVKAVTNDYPTIPAGIVGATVTFEFTDPAWDGLNKTAVFRGRVTRDVLMTGNVVRIPAETVAQACPFLFVGVYGTDAADNLVIPTLWLSLGAVRDAADPSGDPGTDPDLPIWAQLQDRVEALESGTPSDPGSPGTPGRPGEDGEDGGYYTPAVTQPSSDIVEFAFSPSKADMPAVDPVQVKLPVGQGSGGNVDLTGVVKSVNGQTPDANGNVEIAVSGGNGVTVTPYCSFQNRGVLFEHPEPYTAWAKNLRYDSKRKKFVCLVNVDTEHDGDATNDIFFYFVHINSETLHYYDLKQIEPVNADGSPYVFGADEFAYSCSFWIDSEFNYWFWTKSQALFKSEDGGYTWVYQKQMVNPYAEYITNSDTGATALSSLYGLTILSNGRYICSKGGSSKNLYYSDNEGESWTEVTVSTPNALNFFEVEFIEGKNGKVLAIGRATTQVTEGAEINGTYQKPALFAVSDDYGTTWGTAFISKSVNDMNANNCTHFIDKNGVVHLVWCSRRRSDEKNADSLGIERFGVMYYSYANSFDDACMDNFCDARIIGYSQATTENSQSEYGYPSIAVTDDGLMMYVYSDTEDPAVGGVPTYFYGIANKYAYMSPINDTDITVYSAFSTKKVTELLALQKTELMAHITELYSKIGELPPVTEMDGSMYVTDGLIDCWAVQDLETWDTSVSPAKITGAKGNTMSARSEYSVFKANDNGTALVDYITDSVFSDMVTLGDEMTIEAVVYNTGIYTALTITTGNPGTQLAALSSSFNWNGVSGTRLFSPDFTKVTGTGECKHFILTVKDKCLTVWINGVKTNTHGPDDAYVPVDGYLRFNYANGSIAGRDMGHGDIRLYNKALSDEEIQNNYLYAANQFTLTR